MRQGGQRKSISLMEIGIFGHILHCKLHFQHWFRLLTLRPSHWPSNFNPSPQSVCRCSKLWFYLNTHGIMQQLSMAQKEQESEGGEGLCGGKDGMRR